MAERPADSGETGEDSGGGQALAGPFADRLDAEAAVLSVGLDTASLTAVVYGAPDRNGVLRERSTSAERARLGRLGGSSMGSEKTG